VVAGSDICAMDPTLTVEPSAAYPGDTVSVVGQGFPAGVPVAVQLRDAEGNPVGDAVMVTPDEACGFITDLVVPEDAEPGDHVVEAEPEDGSEGAEAPLEILAPGTNPPGDECTDPTIVADPTVVEAGDEVTVTGTGFPAGATVTVQLKDTQGNNIGDPVTVEVDEDCGFTTPITVPEGTPPGVIIVDAQPDDGSEGAQTPITVVAGSPDAGSDDGDDAGAGAGDGTDGGLAATGANVTALIAAMVLLLGAGAVMIKRRREISQAFATAMGRMSGDKPAV
jgi:LPXTG-motif cell wall-anchored protein